MNQMSPRVSRRGIIHAGLAASLGLATGVARGAESRGKAFRVAHLSDMHVVPGPTRSGEGLAMALQSLQQLSPKPDLLITGGDHVMDSLKTNHDKLDPMWDLYSKTLKGNTDLAVHPVIGNHDVLGWEAPDQITPSTAGYGKALYCEKMGIAKPYYSFDAGGWCQKKSEQCRKLFERKFFYIFTCEYCFSHYVTILFLIVTRFRLLLDDWRGYILSFFALVFIANAYMNLYNRLRVDIAQAKTETKKIEKEVGEELNH